MNKKYYNTQKGFYISDLTSTVLGTILLILSIIFALLFALALNNDFKERKLISKLSSYTNEIAQQVHNNLIDVNKLVNNAYEMHIVDYNGANGDDFIDHLKQSMPNVLRVIISSQSLTEIKPEYFPGINYATLDMLKKTKLANENPIAEIHLFGQRDQYLNYIYILDNNNSTYLIISLAANVILKELQEINLTEGSIQLTQSAGEFSLVKLKSWGQPLKGSDLNSFTQHIENSPFNVTYEYKHPFYLFKGITMLSAIIGLVSALVLLFAILANIIKKVRLLREKEKENNSYVHVGDAEKAMTIEETIEQHETEQVEGKSEIVSKDKQSDGLDNADIILDENIFRAYDIRGIVDESLTFGAVKQIGQAIGTENIKRGKTEIVVARDGRLSGENLLMALIEGLVKSGCDVINIGAVPTGVLYFATHHLGTGSGVMLTGSHNPANYNGLKIMLNGETLAGKLIKNLYHSIVNNELDEGSGSEQEMDITDDYIDYISSDIQLENKLKVVVDSGNGIGGVIGPMLLEEIGCEVIPLHCEVDGNFPNHHPDPSVPENLKDLMASVKGVGADIGIAFDGDADRLGVVTNLGEMIFPDRILMLFAKDVLTRQPGASIIFDVKCTRHLPKEIVKNGGLPIIWKTGHSFMKAKIKETNAALAGEMSGHFFFNERWFGFDDGIYAAARLLEILDHEDRPVNEVLDELPNSVSTPELKCETEEGENYAFMEKFQKQAEFPDANLTTIDGIRADFTDGWGLVRCSNTTPCLVMRFDADNEEALDKIKQKFKTQILAVDDSLELPF